MAIISKAIADLQCIFDQLRNVVEHENCTIMLTSKIVVFSIRSRGKRI